MNVEKQRSKRTNTSSHCGNASKKSTTTLPQGGMNVGEPNTKINTMEESIICITPQNYTDTKINVGI